MKRFVRLIGALSFWELIGRYPATAGVLTLLGVGGVVVASLSTPSITPQPSTSFGQAQGVSLLTNNVLLTNGNAAGAAYMPPTPANSFFWYVEGSVDPNIATGANYQYALGSAVGFQGLLVSSTAGGAPTFTTQTNVGNTSSTWWLGLGAAQLGGQPGGTAGTGYLEGYFPWTATGGSCAREPSGFQWAGNSATKFSDPGFLCNSTPTVTAANIPGNGSKQSTGAGAIATTCASNSPVSGEMTVTAHVAIAHGILPGQTYALSGFSPTGYNNAAYVALPGTSGTTLVGEIAATGGTCPAAVTVEGSALSGTGGAVSLNPGISATIPWSANTTTGITTQPGGHFCGVVGEYGAETSTPGFQFAAFTDREGNALPHSPAVVSWPNQGSVNFTGYTITGAQSPSSPAMTVTTMNAYSITGATYSSGTGFATFTTSGASGLSVGSEFTVSGVSPSGFNQTYIAVVGTSGTTVVGNPLAAPLGMPQAISDPGAYSSGGSMVGVIVPGMAVYGAKGTNYIMPYGSFGGTGAGGAGTYGLAGTQGTFTFTGSASSGSTDLTVSGLGINQYLAIGEAISGTGIAAGTTIAGYGSTTNHYTLSATTTGAVSGTVTAAGTLFSSGSPGTIQAWMSLYNSLAPVFSGGASVALTARTQSAIGDFYRELGGYNTLLPAQFAGWGGSLANVADFFGLFPSTGNQPQTSALASLCKKSVDFQNFAATNSLTVNSLYRLNDPGIWADSGIAQFHGHISGTALTIDSTETGATNALTSGNVIAGAGIRGCPSACPTISSGSYPSYTLNTSGGTVASEPMTVGAYKPAAPLSNLNGFNGYISGNTLTVTSIASGNRATFTGSLGYPTETFSGSIPNGSNVLTVSGNPSPNVGTVLIGSVISGTNIPANTFITANGSGTGNGGTYVLNWRNNTGSTITETMTIAQAMYPQPVILSPTLLTVSGVSGTITNGMLITDGGSHIGSSPLLITGGSGTTWSVAPNYNQTFTGDANLVGVSTTLVPGQYVLNSSVTTPVKIIGYGANTPGLCASGDYGCGTYAIVNPAGLSVGSSGSPAAFTATGASDGAAIAPGPALTIKDPGNGVTFPVLSGGTGSLYLSGSYDTGTLGGTPSALQAQVSYTAGGPPISGCSACAWTTVSNATISAGKWSGQVVSIPGGGPYYVSVRAANGTAYATLPSPVKVGIVLDLWGEGQSAAIISGTGGGWANSTYTGLCGINYPAGTFYSYDTGPALATHVYPAQTQMLGCDRFSITGNGGEPLPEGASSLLQNLQNSMGYPATLSQWVRDGAGLNVFVWGNQVQAQSIGIADGTKTTWCSASNFCANVGQGGTLNFNLASMTGAGLTASISGTTLTVGTINMGALQPGAVLSGPGISGSPLLVACTANCSASNLYSGGSGSVWTISVSQGTIGSEAMRADPVGGAPTPYYNPAAFSLAATSYGYALVKSGTFSLSVNGSVVCTDSNTAVYNVMGGDCAGAGIASSFVNYATGDYQITFSTAPASGAVITASWTEIISPDGSNLVNVYNNLDYVGDGTERGGFLSSVYARTPGGSSGHIYGATSSDIYQVYNNGYPMGGVGLTQMLSWFYGVKLPSIFTGANGVPYMNPSTPFITGSVWRADGPSYFQGPAIKNLAQDSLGEDWSVAVATKSLFSGTIASNVLTLSAAATGPMWEGELVGCATFSLSCVVTPGTYITSLASGTWGASGSTYNLGGSPANVGSAAAMGNALYYQGAGIPIYAGSSIDNDVQQPPGGVNGTDGISAHPSLGFTGGRRIASRWAALIYGGLTSGSNASSPTLDRVKANAGGCDVAATAGPCFDIGSTYAASHAATWSGATATITGGLSAHARPFVVGQALSCSGCNSGLVIVSLDVPPTQSAAAGLGEVGQTFHITASGTIGGSGSGTLTGTCSGTSGVGSNCIDFAFSINTGGTYGTAAALATCGENNLNGPAPWYTNPAGTCVSNGIGSLVHGFRIGTNQAMNGMTAPNTLPTAGSLFDDGVDPIGGTFNQSAAFTCNIVAAKVVQCVKGAAYASGVYSGIGQWASGSTFADYLDEDSATGRTASLMGNIGGQPFAFTAGSGYTNGTWQVKAGGCQTTTGASHNNVPIVDVTVAGGSIVDVYGSTAADAIGYAMGANCQFPLAASFTATIPTAASLNVTASSVPLAPGMTVSGGSISGTVTLSTCTSASCFGNPTYPQTWSISTTQTVNATLQTLSATVAAMGTGTGGSVPTPPNWPNDGRYGIAAVNNGATLMGDILYDNSGFPGNPLNSFFTNGQGGYFEPGLPVLPFGLFMGAAVSG